MLNRRLVTAAVLSLGFHAVVLTVVGFSVGSRTESPPIPGRHPVTSVRLSPASESLPAADEPISEPEPIPESVRETAPADIPASSQASDLITMPESREASADGNTGPPGGEEIHGIPDLPEDTGPSLVTAINPVYPVPARRLGVEGVVVLDVVIDPRGVPIECIVIPPRAHKVLEKSALAAVMQARFSPGMENGQPIQDTYRLKVRFELEA